MNRNKVKKSDHKQRQTTLIEHELFFLLKGQRSHSAPLNFVVHFIVLSVELLTQI